MKNIINVYLTQLMQYKRQRRQMASILTVLALVVATVVLWTLKIDGIAMTGEASCGMTEHIHTADCYDTEGNVICGIEEHIHTADCYSDTSADVETEEQWTAAIPTELSGDWASDLIAIANSQIGYQESTRNYALDETVRMGYSRYGAWYGNAYGNWDGMFVSFCLSYANIPETSIPRGAGAFAWSVKMKDSNVYTEGNETITAGDIVFLNRTEDAEAQTAAIVTAVNLETNTLTVIEGDCDNQVMQNEYAVSAVTGYCAVAAVQNPQAAETTEIVQEMEAPAEDAQAEQTTELIDLADEAVPLAVPQTAYTQTAETENYIVTASYNDDAMFPATAILHTVEYAEDSETFQQRKIENGGELDWLLDIGFFDGETEVEPSAAVTVSISFKDAEQGAEQNLTHFAHTGTEYYQSNAVQYGRNENGLWTMTFQTNSFSDFGLRASEKVQKLATFGGTSTYAANTTVKLNFWVSINGEWKNIASAQSYTAVRNNNRYCLSVDQLAQIYSKYGYTAEANTGMYQFGHGGSVWTQVSVKLSNTVYYPLYGVNDAAATDGSGNVYYLPQNTTEYNGTDKASLKNTFSVYAVNAGDTGYIAQDGYILNTEENIAVPTGSSAEYSISNIENGSYEMVGADGISYYGTQNADGTAAIFSLSMTQSYTLTYSSYALQIENNIVSNGTLSANYSGKVPTGAYYVWSKNTNGAANPNFGEVQRRKVTGSSYNIATDGSWLNLALDDGALNDSQTSVQYIVSLKSADGTVLATSEVFDVPYWNSIQNGGFESPAYTGGTNHKKDYVTAGGVWRTTSSDGSVEIANKAGKSGNDASYLAVYYNYNILPQQVTEESGTTETIARNDANINAGGNYSSNASDYILPDGNQFAELNDNVPGALYQDVLTNPGDTMYYQFYHRGRGLDHGWKKQSNGGYSYYNTALDGTRLSGDAAIPGSNSPQIKDRMYVLIMSTELAEQYDVTTQEKVLTVIANIADYPGAYVQTVESDNMQWYQYNGTYTIPSEQYLTRYFFVAGDIAAQNYNSAKSVGNLLDKISFSTKRPEADPGTATITIDKTITGLTDAEAQEVIKNLTFPLTVGTNKVTINGAVGKRIYNASDNDVPENTMVWNNNGGNWKGTFTYTATLLGGTATNYAVTENTDNIDVALYERTSTVTATDTAAELTVSGTLQEKDAKSVSYVNAYVTNSLLISKTAKNYLTGEAIQGTFSFTVTVTDANGDYQAVDQNGNAVDSVVFTDGNAAVTIDAGQSIRILGLPTDKQWTVTETNYDGYTPSYKIDAATKETYSDCASGTIGIENMVSFINTTGPELPKTGGTGAWKFYVIGGILLASTGICALYRRKNV